MIYKDFKGKKLSALGLGCMRFPMLENKQNDGDIDIAKTEEIFDIAIKNGINYFDTAWGYHSGMSEPTVGKILSKYPRESFYLATKFPGYDLGNMGKAEEIFDKQLSRLQTDYVDFYLIHTVSESNIEHYLNDEKYGDFSYFVEQKRQGRIKHIGFSVHASLDITKRFLEKYGEHIDFVQVQLNYIDWNYQDAKAIVDEAIELLGDDVAMVHIKDFVVEDGNLKSVAAGFGEMDYTSLIKWMKTKKPFIHATLEDTNPGNNIQAKEYIQKLYDEA